MLALGPCAASSFAMRRRRYRRRRLCSRTAARPARCPGSWVLAGFLDMAGAGAAPGRRAWRRAAARIARSRSPARQAPKDRRRRARPWCPGTCVRGRSRESPRRRHRRGSSWATILPVEISGVCASAGAQRHKHKRMMAESLPPQAGHAGVSLFCAFLCRTMPEPAPMDKIEAPLRALQWIVTLLLLHQEIFQNAARHSDNRRRADGEPRSLYGGLGPSKPLGSGARSGARRPDQATEKRRWRAALHGGAGLCL